MTAAWTHPVEFVRVVASLVPRELEATTTVHMERMSDAQLEALIARGIEGGLDPAAPDEDAKMTVSKKMQAFAVAVGGKADMTYCTANVSL